MLKYSLIMSTILNSTVFKELFHSARMHGEFSSVGRQNHIMQLQFTGSKKSAEAV
jgi:hypothetical protein